VTVELEVDGRRIRLSSLDRVMWPLVGMTKGAMVDYYARVAPALLPHLAGRPLTLHRFPEGAEGESFFQTRCPPHPSWVRTQRMYVFRSGKEVDAPVIDDLPGLLWAANLSTVELHPYLALAERLEQPDFVVFDLDPGEPADVLDASRVALLLHGLLDSLGLPSSVKTSGASGVHVYVAVTGHTYADTKPFARGVAGRLSAQHPELVVDRMTRSLRGGKVLVDWSQNDAGKSTIAPYSLRGLDVPTVSTPLSWDELEAAVAAGDWRALVFGPGEVLDRLDRSGDLFAPVLEPPPHAGLPSP
jgi:bifunctional non-homologous end joining protein LigD